MPKCRPLHLVSNLLVEIIDRQKGHLPLEQNWRRRRQAAQGVFKRLPHSSSIMLPFIRRHQRTLTHHKAPVSQNLASPVSGSQAYSRRPEVALCQTREPGARGEVVSSLSGMRTIRVRIPECDNVFSQSLTLSLSLLKELGETCTSNIIHMV